MRHSVTITLSSGMVVTVTENRDGKSANIRVNNTGMNFTAITANASNDFNIIEVEA